jgi:hypothetical protein
MERFVDAASTLGDDLPRTHWAAYESACDTGVRHWLALVIPDWYDLVSLRCSSGPLACIADEFFFYGIGAKCRFTGSVQRNESATSIPSLQLIVLHWEQRSGSVDHALASHGECSSANHGDAVFVSENNPAGRLNIVICVCANALHR